MKIAIVAVSVDIVAVYVVAKVVAAVAIVNVPVYVVVAIVVSMKQLN